MSVGRICNRSVATAGADEAVREAARRMARLSVGTLVVMSPDESERPIGILTDRDVATRCVAPGLDPEENTVSSVMSVPVRSVHEDTPIEDALAIMSGGAMRRLVVVDSEGRLAGILALDDVIGLLVEEADAIGRLLEKESPAGGV